MDLNAYDYQADKRKAMDRKMAQISPGHRYRWCNPGEMGCGCMGCVNICGGVTDFEGWKDWVVRNPQSITGSTKD